MAREVAWVGSAREDLKMFPKEVQRTMGFALYWAQRGDRHPRAKPLKGFGGAGVLEVIDDFDGDTYRTVYTIRLRTAIYVLHAFQKKAKHGTATPQREINLIKARLAQAEQMEAQRVAELEEAER